MTDFSMNNWTPSVRRYPVAFVAPWNSGAMSNPAEEAQRRVSSRDVIQRHENVFEDRRV